MRSNQEIKQFIEEKARNIFKRPLSFAPSPDALESLVLSLAGIYYFIIGNDKRVVEDWVYYARRQIGFRENSLVAPYLMNKRELDENWTTLVELLEGFWGRSVLKYDDASPTTAELEAEEADGFPDED